jgi:peptidoglycan/LPS O-acetylase OafA/YrhL
VPCHTDSAVRVVAPLPVLAPDRVLAASADSTCITSLLQFRGRIPALDGLRGLAVLMVMVAHFNQEVLLKQYHPWLGPLVTKFAETGVWGVELFFVLSGFLITGILLDTKENHRYFRNFYARRILRVVPLYYGTLMVVFFIMPLFTSMDEAARIISTHQWRLWLYVTNVPGGPGWDTSDLVKFGHFWSLAVEQHFYLLWPVVVYFVPRRRLPVVCFGLVALGTVARVIVAMGGDVCAVLRWSTVYRIDGLAVGSFVAILVRREELHARMLYWAGRGAVVLGLAFFMVGLIPRSVAPMRLITVIAVPIAVCFFASLLVLSINIGQAVIPVTMQIPVLMSFGKYSYGLYVIHGLLRPQCWKWFPPNCLVAITPIPILGIFLSMAMGVATCYAIAFVSWHLYESQFLRLKKCFE